jgi:Porin subfamily
VKICSLYGVGFYYIPGTDMCIKIGGWVRAEYAWGVNGSSTNTQLGDVNNRYTNNSWWRIRGYLTADARNQTEYGTVRGYIAVGLSTNTTGVDGASNQFSANRAFIQWAGFTFGRAASFFDFYSQAALGYLGFTPNSDTGDGGWEVLAYTAQFGNGFSGSIAAETRRTTQIIGQGLNAGGTATGVFLPGLGSNPAIGSINGAAAAFTATGYGGWQVPDITANLRVDQAWGSAQIGGALHQVNATYYNPVGGVGIGLFGNQEFSGHPGDEWGWAAMAGFKLNTPFFGVGDYLSAQVIYTQGALRYIFQNPNNNFWIQDGGSAAFGVLSDAVYGGNIATGTATSLQLTTAWGINAGYEHFWNPRWRTSLYGGYTNVEYNGQANAILCVMEGSGANVLTGTAALAGAGCDNNWQSWWIGSRTQWNVTKDFYMGLDVAYLKVNSMSTTTGLLAGGTVTAGVAAGAIPGNTNAFLRGVSDQDIWMARFRVHRDFYP